MEINGRYWSCGFCGGINHRVSACEVLHNFEQECMEKMREYNNTPLLFIRWFRINNEDKMVPFTRRIYQINGIKSSRFDEISCMKAIYGYLNSLFIAPFAETDMEEREEIARRLWEAQAEERRQEEERQRIEMERRKPNLLFDLTCDNMETNEEEDCGICLTSYDKSTEGAVFNCNHGFCAKCAKKVVKSVESSCPICRAVVRSVTVCSSGSFLTLNKNKIFHKTHF
jgi:hypothetical protein